MADSVGEAKVAVERYLDMLNDYYAQKLFDYDTYNDLYDAAVEILYRVKELY